MTTISWKMAEKIRKNFDVGLRMRCFENVSVPAAKWKEILEKLDIPDKPELDGESKRWLWKHPVKELELWTDIVPDEGRPIAVIDFYGMRDDFEVFLMESRLGDSK